MKGRREVEVTYAPGQGAALPDLTAVDGVLELRRESRVDVSAVYFDTEDLALLRAGVSLRRRTGGADEGWHLTVPGGGERVELRRPLGRTATSPPKALRDLVAGTTRGAALTRVARVETERSSVSLLGAGGEVLAELVDDRVTGTTAAGETVAWREWRLELVSGSGELIAAADSWLVSQGIEHAEVSTEIARTLGDRVPPRRKVRRPKAAKPVSRVVVARLVDQVDLLAQQDVAARRGLDDGVHQMRVACRRLRALLATFRPVLDRAQTDPVREELRWLAGVLAPARDAAVVHRRLRDLMADEPRSQLQGPVLRRLQATYRARGKADVLAALDSRRYCELRDRLDRLVQDPPWTALADAPAGEVVPRILRKEVKRYRKRVREAAAAANPTNADAGVMHEARKAAKRLRYAAETIEPVTGRAARSMARTARRVTAHLGELQDTAVSRAELLALARTAAAAGEPTFTYGRLHAREQARADQLASRFQGRDTLGTLNAQVREMRQALRRI